MANPYKLTRDNIMEIAMAREHIHRNHASSRPLSDNYEFIGLMGEWTFALETGLDFDTSVRPGGDGGIDFYTSIGTIDVKTGRKVRYLLRERDKRLAAEIFVQAKFRLRMDAAKLLCWEYDTIMVTCPIRTMTGHSIPNHTKSVSACRPIAELLEMLEDDRIYENPQAPRQMVFDMFKQGYGELPY